MTKKEAKEILKYHSFSHEDLDHPKMEKGFLGMLRPFSGQIFEENYHEIMEVIRVLADDLRNVEMVNREIISALWGICHLARSWAIYPEGMLQSNNLISKEQIEKLDNWIEVISYATMTILDGCDDETAFEFYNY